MANPLKKINVLRSGDEKFFMEGCKECAPLKTLKKIAVLRSGDEKVFVEGFEEFVKIKKLPEPGVRSRAQAYG